VLLIAYIAVVVNLLEGPLKVLALQVATWRGLDGLHHVGRPEAREVVLAVHPLVEMHPSRLERRARAREAWAGCQARAVHLGPGGQSSRLARAALGDRSLSQRSQRLLRSALSRVLELLTKRKELPDGGRSIGAELAPPQHVLRRRGCGGRKLARRRVVCSERRGARMARRRRNPEMGRRAMRTSARLLDGWQPLGQR
jgi:hypothetical protein